MVQTLSLLASGIFRAQLLVGVADSSKAKAAMAATISHVWVSDPNAQLVSFIYETALGRDPDAAGLQLMTQELKDGITLTPGSLIVAVAQSPEAYTHLFKSV